MIPKAEKEGQHYLELKKTTCINKRINFKTRWRFLLFELPSLF